MPNSLLKTSSFLTIRNKLYLTSLLGVILLVVISTVSWKQSRAIGSMNQQRMIINNFITDLLFLHESKRNFLIFQKASFMKDFQSRHETLLKSATLLSQSADEEEDGSESITLFLEHMKRYRSLFEQLVPLQLGIGFDQTQGIRKRMRDSLYALEAVLEKVDNTNNLRFVLHREMLMMQRPEKDLMLRRQTKYLGKFENFYKVMKEHVNKDVTDEAIRIELLSAMSEYRSVFGELSDSALKMGLNPEDGIRGEMRVTFEKAMRVAEEMAAKISSEIETEGAGQVDQRVMLVIALAGLVSVLIWMIARSINNPLQRVQLLMFRLANGDLNVEIGEVSRGDEIGTMARAIEVFREHALQRKKAEEALKNSNEILEVRVSERTADLEQQVQERISAEEAMKSAKEEAEQANQAKSQFLSSMSHELRTPLNAILGFGQLMQNSRKEPLKPKQELFIKQILSGGQHLLNLINEILDLAKIESGTMNLSIEEIQHEILIQEAIDLVSPLASERETIIQQHILIGGTLRGDYVRLKQVLVNLLSNAIKYGREKGSIVVKAELIKTSVTERIRLSVSDNGNGIPEEKQSELFKPFSRLGAENSEVEGSGIGLAITKKIVEVMEGEIGFFSEEGKGTTFWVELSAGEQNGSHAEHASQDNSSYSFSSSEDVSREKTLLYIEDNPANLQLMESIMTEIDGIRLIGAHTPHLGLALARTESPSLIVTDIDMPGMNGYEVLERLKRDDKTQEIPVVALSANAMPSDVKRGEAAGFLRYLTKPMDIAEFYNVVDSILEDEDINAT